MKDPTVPVDAGGTAGVRERVHRRRRRRTLRLLAWLCLAALLAWSLWALLQSPLFRVKEVQITGYERLSPETILAAAGLREQVWIGSIRPAVLEERIRRLPRVLGVHVRWGLPDRLSIEVTERRPAALIRYQDEAFLEVDGTGRILGIWEELLPDLILVTGLERVPQEVGKDLAGSGGRRAAALAQALGAEGPERLSEIHVEEDGSLTVYTLSGVPVYMGSEADWQTRAGTLLALLDKIEERGNPPLEYIDLRAVDRPVVKEWRPAGGNGQAAEKE